MRWGRCWESKNSWEAEIGESAPDPRGLGIGLRGLSCSGASKGAQNRVKNSRKGEIRRGEVVTATPAAPEAAGDGQDLAEVADP